MSLFYLLAGLASILLGARYLVDGSTAVAKHYRMSEFLIGLTIVGIGTSMPEMVVSMIGALDGDGTVAIGNIVGSNIANTLLILGVTALIRPIAIEKSTRRFDIPYNIMVTVLLLVLAFGFTFWKNPSGVITRWDGAILLILFVVFMVRSFGISKQTIALQTDRHISKSAKMTTSKKHSEESGKQIKMWLAAIMIVGGLGALIFGGRLFVSGAIGIAVSLGVKESVIAITVMAIGTSMPELATSVVAALKGRTQLALGNILGSNIANITLILGLCAMVKPLDTALSATDRINVTDMYVMILSAVLLAVCVFTFKRKTIDRSEGIMLLLVYAAYVFWLAA